MTSMYLAPGVWPQLGHVVLALELLGLNIPHHWSELVNHTGYRML